MSTLETPTRRPNAHDTYRSTGDADAQCPYCGQPISRKEFKEIQARIESQEKERLAKLEKALAEKATAEIHKAKLLAAEAAEREIAKVKKDALVAVAETRKQAKEAVLATLPAKVAEAVNGERLRHTAEKLKLTDQLEDMKRRLEAKTAHQLSEPAEVDLLEALQTAFPEDRIRRVAKGQKGPDVIMEVIHAGEPVGKIVLDSKNYSPKRWSNAMTRKLRADQLAEGGAFGILVSTVFPSGSRELFLQDGVIVASPQRVVVLVHLLRRIVIDNHVAQLSQEQRDDKADRLYRYICSPGFHDLLDRIVAVTNEIADLDRTETTAHTKIWTRRATLIVGLQRIHSEVSTTVAGIIAGHAE
jgi:hypothetical protein